MKARYSGRPPPERFHAAIRAESSPAPCAGSPAKARAEYDALGHVNVATLAQGAAFVRRGRAALERI